MNPHKKILTGGSFLLFFLIFKFSFVYAATDCTQVTEIPQAECETLLALYNSTNGPNWSGSPGNNWNVTNTPCSWEGINCRGGHVTRIDRVQRNLVGSLPNLSALTQLQDLNFEDNQLTGSIPDLNTLTQLQQFVLYNNQLSGSIPNLTTLTQLRVLDLSSNQLSGSIPNLSTLTQLQALHLDSNQLSGSIPNLSALSRLMLINLSDTQLSGSIPDLSALTQLQYLYLYNTQLSGSIPDLSTLTQLQSLILNTNQLCGEIPSSLVNLSNLVSLGLGDNHLTASDPTLIAFLNSKDPTWTSQTPCGTTSPTFTLELTLEGTGKGKVTSRENKINCTQNTGSCQGTYNTGTTVILTANADPESYFSNWGGHKDCTDGQVQMLENISCIASFRQLPKLTLTKVGEGTLTGQGLNCGEDCTESYPLQTQVTLTAKANQGWKFTGWSKGCQGTKEETQVIMNDTISCTATFEKLPARTLTIQKHGPGTVTTSLDGTPGSLHCGVLCTEQYPHGTLVTLNATPDSGFRFVKWSGEGCADKMTLTEDKTCNAYFESLSTHTLTVNKTGDGQVTSTPTGIDCGPTCTAQFPEGASVELKATAEAGFGFGGWWGDWWQGGGCYGNNPLSLPMDQDTTCHVNFIVGGGTPNLNVWQTSLNFEAPSSTSKTTQTIFLYNMNDEWWWSNPPTAALQLGTITVDKEAFILKDTCSNKEIAPWFACHLEIAFHPQSNEPVTATLSISSNDPDTPLLTLPLHGTVCPSGDPSQLSIDVYPPQLDFGVQPVGDSASLITSLYVSTFGQRCGMPQLDTLQLTGEQASEFRFKDQQCYHGEWGEFTYSFCWSTVVFSPTSKGQKHAELSMTFNDPNIKASLIPIQAQATTETAQIEITPQQIDFGNISLERSASELLTIKNTGKINLKLKDIKMSGSPALTILDLWNCYASSWWSMTPELPPDGQCQITAQFSPIEAGDQEGILTVISNDPDSPTQISFKGKGVEPQDCSESNITIKSTQSGPWGTGSTWDTGTSPAETDVVKIQAGHTIIGLAYTKVKTLCIEPQATLESPDDRGSPLWIQVTDYIKNQGTVRGRDGANESDQTNCVSKEQLGQENCAYPGASISFMTGTQTPNNNGGWWWEGSGSPVRNEGMIIAGKGGNGSRYAAAGGEVTVLGRNTLNKLSGVIEGGEGGHLLGTLQGEAGHGGKTEVWGKLGGQGYLKNYGEMRGGNGGECHPSATEAQQGGHGGDLRLFSLPWIDLGGLQATGKGGNHCQPLGTNGYDGNLIIDPSVISIAGANTQIEGGDVTIFGGKGWVLNLSHLDHPVVRAEGNIVLAVGEGGMIDLRGNQQLILEAQGQVTIFSDKILLEEGKTLNDVIAAPNIVVAPSKILYKVSLTASEKVMGSPGTTVPVVVMLNNSGPEQDTYVLKVTDSKGWPIGPLPETVTVEGLSTVEMAFQVTLPMTRGEMDQVNITATSQADPTVLAVKDIQVGVALDDAEVRLPILPSSPSSPETKPVVPPSKSEEGVISVEETPSLPREEVITLPLPPVNEESTVPPPQVEESIISSPPEEIKVPSDLGVIFLPEVVWTIETCPTTGFINMVCSNKNRVIRDAVLGFRAILSGGELAGTIESQGFVSQVTVQADAVLTGGILSGNIFNQGTIADVIFVGATLQGGTLAGTIRNESRVGGTLVDVTFAPNARLQGGRLQGQIRGDREAPALLESVKVLKGSDLSGVKFGSGVLLEEGVKVEEK